MTSTTLKLQKPATGYLLWKGKSQLDLKTPLICVMTVHSDNIKTDDMIQTWILRQDIPPMDAVKQNKDEPICGLCIHRKLGSCYVEVWQAPRAVWASWKAGNYPKAPTGKQLKKLLADRFIRLGAYGDPAAVPFEVWDTYVPLTQGSTGYTHQWRTHPHFAHYCMASVESSEERNEAKNLGFRTYRVTEVEERIRHQESLCPASEAAGKKITCLECGYCNGNRTGLTGDVTAPVHGSKAKKRKYLDGVHSFDGIP